MANDGGVGTGRQPAHCVGVAPRHKLENVKRACLTTLYSSSACLQRWVVLSSNNNNNDIKVTIDDLACSTLDCLRLAMAGWCSARFKVPSIF